MTTSRTFGFKNDAMLPRAIWPDASQACHADSGVPSPWMSRSWFTATKALVRGK